MDIQHLVDRLEDLIDEGRHMPFSRYTMIDEERALEIIDQMRISIPEEIEKAARIIAQRDRVLAQANEEAARILQDARSKGVEMLEQDVSVQAAQNRAANIIEQARQQAKQITTEADTYVMQVLGELEQNLLRNLNTVRNGISQVNDNQTQPYVEQQYEQAPPPPHVQSQQQPPSQPQQPAPQKEPETVDANQPPRMHNISLKRGSDNNG
jgi:cell division septum initiation protein DivIVA